MSPPARTARRARLIAPLSVMALLWVVSSVPATSGAAPGGFILPPWLQNALHVPVYCLLCATWFWVFEADHTMGRAAMLAFAAAVSYGVVDEIHQAFVPGRTASSSDVTLDAAGAALVLVLVVARRVPMWLTKAAAVSENDPRDGCVS